MRIIFVRHGEPDYTIDSVTEKGQREVELLSKRVAGWNIKDMYVSPYGRAKATAAPSAKALGIEPITLEWLHEYSYRITNPVHGNISIPWDFNPSFLWSDEALTTKEGWTKFGPMGDNPEISENFPIVIGELDKLIESYGYVRHGNYYLRKDGRERFMTSTDYNGKYCTINKYPEDDSEPTIMMVCHFGIICLMLSHLLNIPFELITHGFVLPTSSVTIVNTEERWGSEVSFRVQTIGDCSHLISAGEPISNAGSFARLFQK